MVKRKISATVSGERIEQARAVTGGENLSDLLEQGLAALIERELERRWIAGYEQHRGADDLPGGVEPDLTEVPWREER